MKLLGEEHSKCYLSNSYSPILIQWTLLVEVVVVATEECFGFYSLVASFLCNITFYNFSWDLRSHEKSDMRNEKKTLEVQLIKKKKSIEVQV